LCNFVRQGENGNGKRVWKRRKLEGLEPAKRTDALDYEVWERQFRTTAKLVDLEDVLFDGVEAPIVEKEDEEEWRFLARNLILRSVDEYTQQYLANLEGPREMLDKVKGIRDPTNTVKGMAAWTALNDFEYDIGKSVTQNVAEYDLLVNRYNQILPKEDSSGRKITEKIPDQMVRDMFVNRLPRKAKVGVRSHMRLMKSHEATYEGVVRLVHEIKRELKLDRKERDKDKALMVREHKRYHSEGKSSRSYDDQSHNFMLKSANK